MAASFDGVIGKFQNLRLTKPAKPKRNRRKYSSYKCQECTQFWYSINSQKCKICQNSPPISPYKEAAANTKNTTSLTGSDGEHQHSTQSPVLSWYKCTRCKTEWSSQNPKKCFNCSKTIIVYPRKQIEGYLSPENRYFGYYKCRRCMKNWRSAYAYVDYHQECKACRRNVSPHILTPLKRKDDNEDLSKPHLEALCGKCQALGHCCKQSGGTRGTIRISF